MIALRSTKSKVVVAAVVGSKGGEFKIEGNGANITWVTGSRAT